MVRYAKFEKTIEELVQGKGTLINEGSRTISICKWEDPRNIAVHNLCQTTLENKRVKCNMLKAKDSNANMNGNS